MAYQWTKTDAAAPERVLLIGLDCGDYDAEASMAELERLTDTAGGLVVGHTATSPPSRHRVAAIWVSFVFRSTVTVRINRTSYSNRTFIELAWAVRPSVSAKSIISSLAFFSSSGV